MKKKLISLAFFLLFGGLVSAQQAVVYLDVSMSMRAYMNPNNQALNSYADLLLNLDPLLTASGFSNNVIKRLGHRVMPAIPISRMNQFYNVRRTNESYAETATNLVGALDDIIRAGNPVNLLVTDAVLSIVEGGGAASSDCSQGYDLGCFMRRFAEIIDNKWAVEVVGLTSWFQGLYYSEILRMRGAGYTLPVNQGLNRPFFVFIIGLDAGKTRSIADNIEKWFNNAYKETSLKFRRQKLSPFNIPKAVWRSDMPQFMLDNRNNAVFSLLPDQPFTYRRVPRRMRSDFAKLEFTADIEYSADSQLARYFSLKLDSELHPQASARDFKLEIKEERNLKHFTLFFSRNFIENMPTQAELKIKLWPKYLNKASQLWLDWSTTNDGLEEHLDKTLNISELMTYLLDVSLAKAEAEQGKEVRREIVFKK